MCLPIVCAHLRRLKKCGSKYCMHSLPPPSSHLYTATTYDRPKSDQPFRAKESPRSQSMNPFASPPARRRTMSAAVARSGYQSGNPFGSTPAEKDEMTPSNSVRQPSDQTPATPGNPFGGGGDATPGNPFGGDGDATPGNPFGGGAETTTETPRPSGIQDSAKPIKPPKPPRPSNNPFAPPPNEEAFPDVSTLVPSDHQPTPTASPFSAAKESRKSINPFAPETIRAAAEVGGGVFWW